MKKSISLTLAMLMTMSFFVGCEEEAAPEAHKHAFATEWSSDATKHWHAATCDDEDDCKTAMKDVDGHVDANKDGACDVCAYVVCAHEYATEWSSDATNHWHAATCGCDVKKDEAAHTANAAGVACSVCGAAMTPDVSDVAKAIAVGVAQGDEVAYGAISYVMDSEYYDAPVRTEVSYEVAENYAHVKSVNTQYSSWDGEYQVSVSDGYFTAFGEENVFAIEKGEDGEYALINEEFTQDITEGYLFADFLGYGETEMFYGVENLVSGLYALGADFANNEMTVSVEDGVYTFAFEFVDEYDYIYDVEVAFTLGESYNFENVAVNSDKYLAETTGEGEDLVYSIPADTDPSFTYTYEITQVCGDNIVPAPFDVEEVLITGLTFKGLTNNTVNLTTGAMTKIYVDEIQPATAVFELNAHEITVVDAEGNEAFAVMADFSGDSDGIYMFVTAYAAGEYTLKLANAVTEVELSLVVTNPEVESIWAEIDTTTVYAGSTVEMEVYATEYANQGYTAALVAPTGSSATLTTDGQYVSFTPDVVGEYVVTIKSAEDETITSTVTVTAEAAPTMAEVLEGKYEDSWGYNGIVFTPDETPVSGAQLSGSAVLSIMGRNGVRTMNYTYTVKEGVLAVEEVVDDGAEASGYSFVVNASYGIDIVYNGYTQMSLTKVVPVDVAAWLLSKHIFHGESGMFFVFEENTVTMMDSMTGPTATYIVQYSYTVAAEKNYMGIYEITLSDVQNIKGTLPIAITTFGVDLDYEELLVADESTYYQEWASVYMGGM